MKERKVPGWRQHRGEGEEAGGTLFSCGSLKRPGRRVGSHVTGPDLGRHTEEWSPCPVLLYLNVECPASGAVWGVYKTFEICLARGGLLGEGLACYSCLWSWPQHIDSCLDIMLRSHYYVCLSHNDGMKFFLSHSNKKKPLTYW